MNTKIILKRSILSLIFLCFFGAAITASAAVPAKINYQGKLKESGALVNTTKAILFRIYDAVSAGNLLWQSGNPAGTAATVTVTNGLFTYVLGGASDATDLTAVDWENKTCYLEVVVAGTTLTPRELLVAVPYALSVKGLDVDTNNNVGIGTTNPGQKLDVAGDIQLNDNKLRLRPNSDGWHWLYWNTDNYTAVKSNSGFEVGDGTNWYTRLSGTSSGVSYINAGNVGIGTTGPNALLDVRGREFVGGGTSTFIPQSGTSLIGRESGDTFIGIHSNGYGLMVMGWDNSEDRGTIAVDSSQDIAFITDAGTADNGDNVSGKTPKLIIKGGGNVGIGTTGPVAKLDIKAPHAAAYGSFVTLLNLNGYFPGYDENAQRATIDVGVPNLGNTTYGHIAFATKGSDGLVRRLYIGGDGNVGIGTTTPATVLDIGGGSAYINSNATYQLFNSSDKIVQLRGANQAVISLLSDVNTDGGKIGGLYFGRTIGQTDAWINLIGIRGIQRGGTGGVVEGDLVVQSHNGELVRFRGDTGYVGIGTTTPGGKLEISSTMNAAPTTGSILLTHPSSYQRNSIVFPSRVNWGSDYGFIEYRDDDNDSGEAAQLTIGTSNDADDDVVIDPSGRLTIAATNTTLDTSGNLNISGTVTSSGGNSGNWNSAYTHSTTTTNVHGLTYTAEGSGGGLDADTVDGYQLSKIVPYHSGSDFPNGTLVTTDIPANTANGDSFVIEISGKSYSGSNPPFKVIAQGYLYNSTIISYSGLSYGGSFASYIKMFEDGGVLKFWWPSISYWNSFNVHVRAAGGSFENRVTSIANSTEPTGTKKVQVNLEYFWRASNDGATSGLDADYLDGHDTSYFQTALTNPVTGTGTTSYLPKFTGASTIGNSLIYDNGTNVGIGTAAPGGKLDVRVAGSGNWDRLVVKTTSLWGDGLSSPAENGGTEYVTIGAGGAEGIMLKNPHVVWTAANSGAAIRYGRAGGVTGGKYWDVGTRANDSFSFSLEGISDHKMTITSAGNVGIGTTAPASLLGLTNGIITVGQSANDKLQIYGGTGFGSLIRQYNGSGTETIRWDAGGSGGTSWVTSGNVGIGTIAPGALLDVQGAIYWKGTNVAAASNGGAVAEVSGNYPANNSSPYTTGIGSTADWGSSNAIDGDMTANGAGSCWLDANGENGITFIKITFNKTYVIDRVRLAGRYDAQTTDGQPQEFQLDFSDGSVQTFTFPSSYTGMQEYMIRPVSTSFIRYTTRSKYTTGNNGLREIEAYTRYTGATNSLAENRTIFYNTAKGSEVSANVGIGTTGPSQRLQVTGGNVIIDNTNWYYGLNSSGAAQPLIRSRGMGYSPASYPGLQIGQTGDNIALFIDPNSVTGGAFNGGTENEIFLPNTANFIQANSGGTDWMSTMYFKNGNVGIGTSDPGTYKLYVNGPTYINGVIVNNGALTFGGNLNMQNNLIENIGNANTDFTSGGGLTVTGNVGIGNTTPGHKLTVTGNVAIGAVAQNYTDEGNNLHIWPSDIPVVGYAANLLIEENDAEQSIGFLGPNTAVQKIVFGRTNSVGAGQLQYDHNTSTFGFSGGNVGIGTTSPASLLSLSQATNPTLTFTDTTAYTGAGGAGSVFGNIAMVGSLNGAVATNNIKSIVNNSNGVSRADLAFFTSDGAASTNEKFRMSWDGVLQVYNKTSSGSSRLLVREGATQSTAEALGVYANDGTTARLVVQNGNVGIGTTAPTSKLQVSGGDLSLQTTKKIILDSDDAGDTYIAHDTTNDRVSIYVDGIEMVRINK